MTEQEIIALIIPYLQDNPKGIFDNGEFDLDYEGSPQKSPTFLLWVDGNTCVRIPISCNKENAGLIQKVVSFLGREVVHTWEQQYSSFMN